ncbi:MAG: DNA-3-methyladenine glycosylase 2 family protein [Gemmatimonadetes bacterium]|nr:DNA-3-methyladenine glycosylase 2 family protein [Gemmatimonadota bacterium]
MPAAARSTPGRKPKSAAQRNSHAVRALKKADPRLGAWIARCGPCDLEPDRGGTHFDHLMRCIVGQQLSGKAAETIFRRFIALFPPGAHKPSHLLGLSDEALRGSGLSRGKMAALRDLAHKVENEALPLHAIDGLPDDEVIALLTQVRGIGRWTAQMMLMFRLGRQDIVPELDLGVQKGARKIYGLRQHPTPKKLEALARAWAPNRTIASWYCWRVLELDD